MKSGSFKIAGQSWKLKVLKKHAKLGDDSFGYCDSDNNIIYLHAETTNDQQKSTLLHEAIHALEYIYDIDLTEHQVKCLESGLFSIFNFRLRT